MILSKLEIFGFKSFLDRTEINFGKGITAIVGPNGCGKSNVADAIRWVLGEQSAKTLRGSNMQDIIFSGTASKKSVSYCEVSLFFDNKDKSLPLEYDEVVVSRKLYRNGDSEYSINNNTCRLKDITDIMRKAQVGREGYSIIGQGRVEQFINLRPEERRDIFDEATGIASSKQKKQESERKLSRAKENLVRYMDIIGELEKQVEPLKEQAVVAKEYLELKEKLKFLEINNFIYKNDFAEKEKEKLFGRVSALSEELVEKEKLLEEVNSQYEKYLSEISDADDNVSKIRNRQLELAVEREKADGENHLRRQRIELLSMQIDDLVAEKAELQLNLENLEKLKYTGLDELKGKEEELSSLKKEYDISEEDFSALEREKERTARELVLAKREENENSREIFELEGRLKTFENSLEYVNSAITESISESKSAEIEKIESELEDKKLELQETIEGKEELTASISELTAEINSSISKIELLTSKINDGEKRKEGLSSQRNFLSKMKDSFDGFSASVRKLLLDARSNQNLSSKIEGVVANLISVPKNLEIAVEASLGNAIQNVVTASVEDTKYLISYLKERKHGIVTFLPIPFVKPRILTRENSECLSMKGVLGVASELVEYDSKYRRVMQSLLGATVIVDNMDNAIEVAKRFNSSFKIVTKSGEILSTGGSISGGSYKPQIANILSYDREITELEAEIAKLDDIIERGRSTLSDLKEEVNDNGLLKSNHVAEEKRLEIKTASLKELISSLENSCRALTSEIATKEEKKKSLLGEISEIERKREEVQARLTGLENSAKDLVSKIERLEKEGEVISEKLKEGSEAITQRRVLEAKLKGQLAGFKLQIEKLDQDKLSYQKQLIEKERAIQNGELNIKKANEELSSFVDKFKDEFDEVSKALSDYDEYKRNLAESLKSIDKERTAKLNEVTKLSGRKENSAIELERVDFDIAELAEKMLDEYGLDYSNALFYKDENFKQSQANSQIKKTKEQIVNLGNVNVNAIEDLEIVSARYEEMTKQREDILKTEEDLRKVISELSEEMKAKFDEGFTSVNEYFSQTFRELFGGGVAKLKLVENENGDKLQYGVDIEAQPPGKSLQNINLLSGGEKALTAIAIIIAIMKLRPMPFCIFDEIESALDELNTIRFARYLQRFEDGTQFILVTHKKSTMEVAERIFGVTMQEKGISKILSVNLSEAVNKAI